jgi:peptidoglycan/LPS O-acetylase OafA/YrhL
MAVASKRASDNPEAAKLEEYAAFDVLRFILASTVMLVHMDVVPGSLGGNLSVQVFFALSGWLIGGILYKTSGSELSQFYFNRSTRIWIPYFFTVLALYLASFLHEPVRSSRWFEFLVYDLTFTHNWFTLWPDARVALSQMPLQGTGSHLWSLAVEEQFYLLAPLIMTLLPFGRRMLPWICVAAAAYLSRSEYASVGLGVLSAVAAQKYPKWHRGVPGNIALLLALAAASVALAYCDTHVDPRAGFSASYLLAAPMFSICVVLLCAKPLRRNSITRWLGGVSFPFYLNAWIGIYAVHAIEKHFSIQPSWYSSPLLFLSALAAGATTYHLIDIPVMAHRERYYRAWLGWTLGAVGYALIITGVVFWIHLSRAQLASGG